MKILFGVQGTGQGHLSRAGEILPVLQQHAEVDVLISGYEHQIALKENVVHRKRGISLVYDRRGGISFIRTATNIQLVRFLSDVQTLDLSSYDLIISDYEPVSAWAAWRENRPCIGMSHQCAFESKYTPRPEHTHLLSEMLLSYFAPVSQPIGFHFKRYDTFIHPPIIRQRIRELEPESGNHVTVYLSAHDPKMLVSLFKAVPEVNWHIFSGRVHQEWWEDNVRIHPVDNDAFVESLRKAYGVICGAGFQSCSEALYLGKKLLVVPISYQYEQLCNVAALREMGVYSHDFIDGRFISRIREWLNAPYPDRITETADVSKIFEQVLDKSKV